MGVGGEGEEVYVGVWEVVMGWVGDGGGGLGVVFRGEGGRERKFGLSGGLVLGLGGGGECGREDYRLV